MDALDAFIRGLVADPARRARLMREAPDYREAVDHELREMEFLRLDSEGRSAREIALILGVTQRTVTRMRARAGRLKRPATVPRPQEDRDLARMLLDEGCHIAEVARTVGVEWPTIRRWFPDAAVMSRRESGVLAAASRKYRRKAGVPCLKSA